MWITGLAAPRHVGSSQTRARTRAPCISRQIPNHCATREAPRPLFFLTSRLNLQFPSSPLNMSTTKPQICPTPKSLSPTFPVVLISVNSNSVLTAQDEALGSTSALLSFYPILRKSCWFYLQKIQKPGHFHPSATSTLF